MPSKILISKIEADTKIALIEENRLSEFYFDKNEGDALTGNIYVGRVETIQIGMQAAFVNIGLDKNAFLHFSDLPKDRQALPKPVKVGEEIPVQITKLPGGEKGVRVSACLTLPGRYSVLMPGTSCISISKRIEDENERKRLSKLVKPIKPDQMGVIVRTNAENAEKSEIENDIQSLIGLWTGIEKRLSHVKAPACIFKDNDPILRCMRDLLTDDVEEIIAESNDAFEAAQSSARLIAPDAISKIHLHTSDIPLFSIYSIKKQLDDALSRRIWLKSGGFLIFDKTEALTVIDVNTGKFVGKTSLSDTVFKLNLEAAEEIAHQLRLRDIGGIIVIDFIDMDSRAQKDELVKALREFLKKDKTHTTVHGLTALGLVEMTRKKKREPLEASFKSICPVCKGEGMILNR
ncbi:MAG: Rne/Rng family ribonuclease [Clostridiales bacterium]|nr:Rne/Rng family ribonuclease [Clostridiales bacterium]